MTRGTNSNSCGGSPGWNSHSGWVQGNICVIYIYIYISHDGSMVDWYIYLRIYHTNQRRNVGKHASSIDPMGYMYMGWWHSMVKPPDPAVRCGDAAKIDSYQHIWCFLETIERCADWMGSEGELEFKCRQWIDQQHATELVLVPKESYVIHIKRNEQSINSKSRVDNKISMKHTSVSAGILENVSPNLKPSRQSHSFIVFPSSLCKSGS